jgi:drug/metabolite transporter, DME family
VNEKIGYLFIVLTACFWALAGTVVKLLYHYHFDSTSLSFLRAFFAFSLFLIYALVFRRQALRIHWKDLPFFAIYAFLSITLFSLFLYQGFALASVGTIVVLVYTSPILVVLIARVMYGEPLTPAKIGAFALAIGGCALSVGLYRPGSLLTSPLAILLGVGCSITMAVFGLYGKKATGNHSSLTILVYTMGFGALFLFPFSPQALATVPAAPPMAWLLLAVQTVLVTVVPYALYMAALRRIEVSRASLVGMLQPVVATTIAFLVLGETMEPLQLLGAALVISAAVLTQASRPPSPIVVMD